MRGPSLIEFPLPHDRSLTVVGSRNGKYRAHHAGPSVAHKPQLQSLPDVYKPTTNPLSHATNAMSSNVGPIDRHRQVRHSDAGCVWVAAICRETPSAANSLIGIVRFLRRSDRPSATLNLRVGGSIPPRLTSLRSHLSRRLSAVALAKADHTARPHAPHCPQHSDPASRCRLRILHGARQ